MAIAFDAATNPVLANAASLTYSHTCTGSELILYVSVFMRNITITGVTYNGTSMTEIDSRVYTGQGDDYFAHYYLIAPSTGANDVVVSGSASNVIISGATSYTGCKQSAQPDSNNNVAGITSADLTTSTTTVADNSWVVLSARSTTGTTNAGTGTTQRATTTSYHQMYDKNGPVTPAGSASVNTTQTSSLTTHLVASFAPAVAASTFTPKVMFF